MRFVRPVHLALVSLLAVAGCRTAGVDNLAQRPPVTARPSVDAKAVVAEHNRNAERIQSIQAKPDLSVAMDRGRPYGVDGRLAMERPRNFKLEVSHIAGGEVADIGSNDQKFWFWVQNNKDKSIYYCNYDEAGATPATLQPDWIMEALGLRVIPEDEAEEITVTRGQDPDSLILAAKPTRIGGEMVTRKMIVSERTRRIREYRLYSDQNALLARATIPEYQSIAPIGASASDVERVLVPHKLKLEWIREKLTMEVVFDASSTKINVKFPDEQRQALFVEEPRKGYTRKNLATFARVPGRAPTTIRETRPAPPSGVELGTPTPVDVDGAARTPRDPVALSADLPSLPSYREELVGPAIPAPPELRFARPGRSGWRSADGPAFEQ